LEECESAKEFLLEPWVLLQLPFEPTILHQWTVALMAEALRFKKKYTDFTTMAYPEHLKQFVDQLTAMNILLLNGANFFMLCISKLMVRDNSMNHMHVTATLFNWNEFEFRLSLILPVLNFILSEECDTLISALKRMAWSKNAVQRTCKSEVNFLSTHSFYCYDYWDGVLMHQWLFNAHQYSNKDQQQAVDHKINNHSNYEKFAMDVTDEKIVKHGLLQGESRDIILQIATKNRPLLQDHYIQYVRYKGKSCSKYAAKSNQLILSFRFDRGQDGHS
jgi:hypothetical protein